MPTNTQSTRGKNSMPAPQRSIPQPLKQASTGITGFGTFVSRSAVARRSMS